ncbi:MAG TPA: HEAT repeat domain-containing protein [Thermoanaerobaculia bacterium]|nr:HEAT repeat domain-containing protein [Thermoanaerobaculia bacterium]
MRQAVFDISRDPAEDLYTRLEARSFLVAVSGEDAHDEFGSLLAQAADASWRLESIVTLADTPSASTVDLLKSVIGDPESPFFLRSAAAWALGYFPSRDASVALVKVFSDVERELRYEAVTALLHSGANALEPLLEGLGEGPQEVAAGCFEVLRRLGEAPVEVLLTLAEEERAPEWAVWLLASLPRSQVAPAIASWQAKRPDLHFALSVLWSFLESWVSEIWERDPGP